MSELAKDDCGEQVYRFVYKLFGLQTTVVSIFSAQFMKEIRQLKEKGKPDGMKDRTDGLVAAMRIQKVWRGFATRRKTRRGKLEEMYLIGMVPHPVQRDLAAIEDAEQVRQFKWIWLEIDNVVMWGLFQRSEHNAGINCRRHSKKTTNER